MIRHVWSVLCSRSSIDQTTNNVSLFEVLESIQVFVNMPVAIPGAAPFAATLVTLWARERLDTPAFGHSRFRILGPTGQPVLPELMAEIDLRTAPRTRARLTLPGLPFSGDGVYNFEVSWRTGEENEWVRVASVPLEVTMQVEPAATTAPPAPQAARG
jgi:hypothetical protein